MINGLEFSSSLTPVAQPLRVNSILVDPKLIQDTPETDVYL